MARVAAQRGAQVTLIAGHTAGAFVAVDEEGEEGFSFVVAEELAGGPGGGPAGVGLGRLDGGGQSAAAVDRVPPAADLAAKRLRRIANCINFNFFTIFIAERA